MNDKALTFFSKNASRTMSPTYTDPLKTIDYV